MNFGQGFFQRLEMLFFLGPFSKLVISIVLTVSILFTGLTVITKIGKIMQKFFYIFLGLLPLNQFSPISTNELIKSKVSELELLIKKWDDSSKTENEKIFDQFNKLARNFDRLDLTWNPTVFSTDTTLAIISSYTNNVISASLLQVMEYSDITADSQAWHPFHPDDLSLTQIAVLLDSSVKTVMFYRSYVHLALLNRSSDREILAKAAYAILNETVKDSKNDQDYLETLQFSTIGISNIMNLPLNSYLDPLPMRNWDSILENKEVDLMGKAFFETQYFIRLQWAKICKGLSVAPGMDIVLEKFPYQLQNDDENYNVVSGSLLEQLKVVQGFFPEYLEIYTSQNSKKLLELIKKGSFPDIRVKNRLLKDIVKEWLKNPKSVPDVETWVEIQNAIKSARTEL